MSNRAEPSRGQLEGENHYLPVRVYFEDTDVTGVVYHASYVRFCERGRTDLLALLGVNHSALMLPSGENMIFAVSKFTIDYRRPAYLDDALVVKTCLKELRGARMRVDQRILRDGEELAVAQVEVVTLDRSGRPRRMPRVIVDKLAVLTDQGSEELK